MPRSGNLIIVSGPSGAGKSVLVDSVVQAIPGLRFSVSHTTRPPRDSEREGVHYYFVDQQSFENLIARDEFLEWAQVYGNYYGTSRKFIDESLARGEDVILDVDVQGAHSVRRLRPEAVRIFIMPPSFETLRERLERRKLDKDYVIANRLRIAGSEIVHYEEYEYLIINSDFSNSLEEMKSIILGSRCRIRCRREEARAIVATFGGMNAKNP